KLVLLDGDVALAALEIKAGFNFPHRLVDRIGQLLHIHFGDDIKRVFACHPKTPPSSCILTDYTNNRPTRKGIRPGAECPNPGMTRTSGRECPFVPRCDAIHHPLVRSPSRNPIKPPSTRWAAENPSKPYPHLSGNK